MSNRVSTYTHRNGVVGDESKSKCATESLRDQVFEAQQSLASRGENVFDEFKGFVRKRPAVAIGAAVVAGLLLGFWTKRR